MEKISANFKLMESKRDALRRSILSLSTGWNVLEAKLDLAEKKTLDEGVFELDEREDGLNRMCVVDINDDVKLLGNSLQSGREELQRREVQFSLYELERFEHLRTREELMDGVFEEIRMSVGDSIKDAGLREKKVELKLREIEEKEADYQFRSAELDMLHNRVEKRIEVLNVKEQQFEGRWKELLLREKEVEVLWGKYKECNEDFIVKEKQLWERSRELESKENEFDERFKDLLLREKEVEVKGKEQRQFQGRWKELLQREKEVDVFSKELDSKKLKFDSVEASFDQFVEEFNLNNKQFKLDKQVLEKHIKEFDIKREDLVEKSEEIQHTRELLQQQAMEIEVERKKIKKHVNAAEEDVEMLPISGSTDIYFVVTMDGKNLQLFLNESCKDHNSMCEEVLKMLRLSRDPAMLVLDAMEGFYPPHLSKGDKTFESSVVRSSCILLLQQLGKISMQIQSNAKERALRLAEEWMRKLSLTDCNFLEVFGFLHLLASYRLVPDFDVDYIIKLLDFVAEDNQVFELCSVPGFAEKVPDLIKGFLEKSRYIVAVRFICKFDLVDKFPPVPLLKKYLKLRRKSAHSSCEAQNTAMDERLASLRAVVNCILEFDLQSEYPPTRLQNDIEHLLKQKSGNNDGVLSNNDPSDRVKLDPLVYSNMTMVTCILANMDAKSLLQFLSNHLSELELMQKDVSKVLKMSSNPGEFVIDALEEFQHSMDVPSSTKRMSKRNINTMKSFLFVLELLAGIPFEIEIPVLEAAKEIALDWKEKLSLKENPVHILAFLQLICTYKLTSEFDPNELYNLCCSVSDCKELPQFSEILALSEKVPVSKILNVQDKMKQLVSETSPLNLLAGAKIPDLIRLSPDPASLILDAMECCYFSNLEEVKSAESATGIFVIVLKDLLNVAFETRPCTQAKALRFAAVWKAKLLESTSKSQEVACFLLFLALYKLASLFDCDELFFLLNFYDNKFAINLLRHFSLDKRRPELIKNLIAKEQKLDALICIYNFNLINTFPPLPILKSYLASEEGAARKICNKDHTPEAVGVSADEELTALRTVIKSFVDRGLNPPNEFNRRVKFMLVQNKADGEKFPCISQSQKPEDGRIILPPPPPITDVLVQNKADEEMPSISESQKPEDGRITVLPPPPITYNKEEHTDVLPSLSGKKRPAHSPPPHGSKRKAVSSSSATSSVRSPFRSSSTIIPLRCPNVVYVPRPSDPPSFTYYRDQTSHLPPNAHSWQSEGYGPGMAHNHHYVNHFPSFSGANPECPGQMQYGWPNQNHLDPNYISRRYPY